MSLLYLIAYWYTYSKYYILGTIFVTVLLNHAFKKLWLSPLIINAISLIILYIGIKIGMVTGEEINYSVTNVYLPVVFFSAVMNIVIYSYKKIKNKLKS